MEIKDKLIEFREKKGLSQTEVASIIGVSPSAISNYEQGIRVPKDSIKKKLSELYEVGIVELFF